MPDKPKSKLDHLPPRRSLFASAPMLVVMQAMGKIEVGDHVALAKSPAAKLVAKVGRPRIEDKDKTAEALKPWKEAGMSRSTWYGRKKSLKP